MKVNPTSEVKQQLLFQPLFNGLPYWYICSFTLLCPQLIVCGSTGQPILVTLSRRVHPLQMDHIFTAGEHLVTQVTVPQILIIRA